MKFTDSIKERLLSGLAGGLIALATLTGGLFLKEAHKPLFDAVLPAVSKTTLLLTILLLLTICLVSVPWLLALLFKKEEKEPSMLEKYNYLADRSIYIKKGGKELFCGNCMTKGIESPLGALPGSQGKWWICINKECSRQIARFSAD